LHHFCDLRERTSYGCRLIIAQAPSGLGFQNVGISLQSIWIIDSPSRTGCMPVIAYGPQTCCLFAAYHACQDSNS
jgi:hypothetical protein